MNLLLNNLHLTDMETCYKVFQGDLIRSIILTSHRFDIEPELTAKIAKIKNLKFFMSYLQAIFRA